MNTINPKSAITMTKANNEANIHSRSFSGSVLSIRSNIFAFSFKCFTIIVKRSNSDMILHRIDQPTFPNSLANNRYDGKHNGDKCDKK